MTKTATALLLTAALLLADTVVYKYDDTGRLISATYGNGAVVNYTYDGAGNLLSRGVPGTAPQISATGVVNAASYLAPLVRGELASLFGANLATGTFGAATLPLSTSLGGAQITVAGFPAPLVYVSPTQINFQVPFEAPASGSVPVVAAQSGLPPSPAQQVAMAEYAPGVFTYARTATVVDPIIVHGATNALVTPDNPASAGEVLVIYATGAGSFDNPPATGAAASAVLLANTAVLAGVTVGGTAAQVAFSGLTPGDVGLLQINITLPAPLPAGNTLPLVVRFGTASAPPVNLYVR
jgi:uncharacterized protein (TIGR03437 family)